MDILFKKVFNNRVIFKIIFDFVQYKDTFKYESYNEILNSRNIYEINLVELIERKQYKTFDYFFELLFNDQGEALQQKHWYNRINFKNEPKDHYPVVRYKQLGLNRFKQYYKLYGPILNYSLYGLLEQVVKSGNIEIVNYLFELYPNLKKYNLIKYIDVILYQSNAKTELDCGNSLEIFNLMVKPDEKQIFGSQKNIAALLLCYSEIDHFNIYSTLLEKLEAKHYYSIVLSSFKHKNLPLAKSVVNSTNFQEYLLVEGKDNFVKLLFRGASKLSFTFSELYYEILMVYIESVDKESSVNYRNILVKKCPKSVLVDVEIKLGNEYYKNQNYIYIFKFGEIGDNDKLLASFVGDFYPNSIEEYEYILGNEQLLFEFYDLEGYRFQTISQYIAINSHDLQFIKYCYHHWFEGNEKQTRGESKKQATSQLLIKILLNSSNEISSWFIENHLDLIKPTISTTGPTYTFSGSLERLKQFESFGIRYDKEASFRECSKRGYLDIVKYLLPFINVKPTPYFDMIISSALVCSTYNQFSTFQYLVRNIPQQRISNLKTYTDVTLGNKFIHFLYDNDSFIPHKFFNSPNRNTIIYSDFQIFKLVAEKQSNLITDNVYKLATGCTNFKIFEYIIGNYLLVPGGDNDILKEKERLIVNLANSNQKKLLYLLGYSFDSFLKYYKITIKKSILLIQKNAMPIGYHYNNSYELNSIFILQQLLLLSSTVYKNSIDKQQIYLEIIYYSILFKCETLLNYLGGTAQLDTYGIDKSIVDPIKLLDYDDQFKDLTQRQFNTNINQFINDGKLNFLYSIETIKQLNN